jgi:hypothetical protein
MSSQDYQDCREKPDHSHLVSDRASNYFVSGEDDIKPGAIPGDTIRMDAYIHVLCKHACNYIIHLLLKTDTVCIQR